VVAHVTGLSDVMVRDCYQAIDEGRTIPMVQTSVTRILRAPDTPGGAGYLPSTGSTRRLQALTVMGWSMAELGTRYGVDPSTLTCIRSGRLRNITGHSAALVDRMYAELWDQRGPGRHAATRARNRGWFPPLAWDDETIDDPTAEPASPDTPTVSGGGRPSKHTFEDVTWVLEDEPLASADDIGRRLGLTRDGIYAAIDRYGKEAGVEDHAARVRAQLKRNSAMAGAAASSERARERRTA